MHMNELTKKRNIRILLIIISLLSLLLLPSCSSGDNEVFCEDCANSLQLNEDIIEHENGDTQEINTYVCKDCAYSKGYEDGHNDLYDELLDFLDKTSGEFYTREAVEKVLYSTFDSDTADKLCEEMANYNHGYRILDNIDYIDQVEKEYEE